MKNLIILGLLWCSLFELKASAATAPAKPAAAAAPAVATSPITADSIGLRPEAISAKTVLGDLLARRYSQGLSTFIDRQYFNVGVELVLDQSKKDREPASQKTEEIDNSLPSDLLLGSIDLDEVMKGEISPEIRDRLDQFLSSYQIKSVNISVGVQSLLGDEVKAKAEKYIQDRVKDEFGSFGKGTVAYIMDPSDQKKNFLDQLNKFQSLVGQLALALALLLGAILWSLSSKKQSSSAGAQTGADASINQTVTMNNPGAGAAGGSSKDSTIENLNRDAAETKAAKEITDYTNRLVGMTGRLNQECESVLRLWSQSGEEGIQKLACFAEAVGGEMGKLPIPVDSMKELTKAFIKMPEMSIVDKRNIVVKIYWDIMMAINLGTETLERPFGYLSTMKSAMINQVLVDQNPKMKTLVTLFMPDASRNRYISAQDEQTKLELLRQALDLNEIATDELRAHEGELKSSIPGGSAADKDVVVIDSAFLKIVNALTPSEEMTMLSKIQGKGIDLFKRTQPSLAFVHEWADDQLRLLFSRATPDEVVVYLRVFPDFKDRVISMCPPMTAEVALDELDRPEKGGEKERNLVLVELAERMKALVDSQEVALENAFSPNNVESIGTAKNSENDNKQAA